MRRAKGHRVSGLPGREQGFRAATCRGLGSIYARGKKKEKKRKKEKKPKKENNERKKEKVWHHRVYLQIQGADRSTTREHAYTVLYCTVYTVPYVP